MCKPVFYTLYYTTDQHLLKTSNLWLQRFTNGCFSFGLYLGCDSFTLTWNLLYIDSYYQNPRRKSNFLWDICFSYQKKNRDGWIKQVSTLQTRHVLLCSYSLVKASPKRQAEWCHWSTEITIQGKSLQFKWQQVDIYNSCIKKDRVLAIIKNKPQ